jgi:hypothetical protein
MEVMLSLAIATVLVIALTQLYRTVVQVGVQLRSTQTDWNAEQFMRSQTRLAFVPVRAKTWFEGRSTRLFFTSVKSMASGVDGRPVASLYTYDPVRQVLYYQERALPPWWGDVMPLQQLLDSVARTERTELFRNVERLAFAYHDGTLARGWIDSADEPPFLIRLEVQSLGKRKELLLEFGARFAIPQQPIQ